MKRFEYTLTNPMGLHMRPAGIMVNRLAKTSCGVTLHCGARDANAKSILSVMAMSAKCGERVIVDVSGEGEEALSRELEDFFKQNF